MSDDVSAEIRVWIECIGCGRIEKPTICVQIPKELAAAKLEKVCLACECCGAHAMMYLQRTVNGGCISAGSSERFFQLQYGPQPLLQDSSEREGIIERVDGIALQCGSQGCLEPDG